MRFFCLVILLLLAGCHAEDKRLPGAHSPVYKLTVTPSQADVPVGFSQSFSHQILQYDGKLQGFVASSDQVPITWISSDPSVATVNQSGEVIALRQGQALITAAITRGEYLLASDTAVVTVTNAVVTQLWITPAQQQLALGLSSRVAAYAKLSDGAVLDVTENAALRWSTPQPELIEVKDGKVTALAVGSATLIASGRANGQEFSAQATVTVTNAVVTQLWITPAQQQLALGLSSRFAAYAKLSDGAVLDVTENAALRWSTPQTELIDVKDGKVTGLAVGSATLIASGRANGQEFSAQATVTVTNAVVTQLWITPAQQQLALGLSSRVAAYAKLSDGAVLDVTENAALRWSSPQPELIDVKDGKVTGLAVGSATLIASGRANGQEFSAQATVTVTEAEIIELWIENDSNSLAVGLQTQLQAYVRLSDNRVIDVGRDERVQWYTEAPAILQISNSSGGKGVVTGVSVGDAVVTLTAEYRGQRYSTSTTLSIRDAVLVELVLETRTLSLPKGLSATVNLSGRLSDGTLVDLSKDSRLSWYTDSSDIVEVNQGVMKALKSGSATIIVRSDCYEGQCFDELELTVTDPVVIALEVSAPKLTVTEFFGVQLRVLAQYSDNSVFDVTQAVTWNTDPALRVVNGYVSAERFTEGGIYELVAHYQELDSAPTIVEMVSAKRSIVIGRETSFATEVSSDIYPELAFQGSAVLDGIYDAKTGALIAGGFGGGLNPIDQQAYADTMLLKRVSSITGIAGTAWAGSKGSPLLQMLEWNEGDLAKKIGKLNAGVSTSVQIENTIYGIVVYSSNATQPRYITGIQFIYK